MTGIEAIDKFVTVLGQRALATWRVLCPNLPSEAACARIRPFIVLCAPRTGSTHLLELLRQHRQIEAWFEVFHEEAATRDRIDGRPARDDEEGAAYFDKVEASRHAALIHFPTQRTLIISYERLIAEQGSCMNQICGALDLPHFQPESVKRKFEYLPMTQRLANYDSLAASFAGTSYEQYFSTETKVDS